MKQCSTSPHNVQKWNNNDVFEWLKREKLEIFQNALHLFTGKELWQLYKIKSDSPSDYYRIIETLLGPEIPS